MSVVSVAFSNIKSSGAVLIDINTLLEMPMDVHVLLVERLEQHIFEKGICGEVLERTFVKITCGEDPGSGMHYYGPIDIQLEVVTPEEAAIPVSSLSDKILYPLFVHHYVGASKVLAVDSGTSTEECERIKLLNRRLLNSLHTVAHGSVCLGPFFRYSIRIPIRFNPQILKDHFAEKKSEPVNFVLCARKYDKHDVSLSIRTNIDEDKKTIKIQSIRSSNITSGDQQECFKVLLEYLSDRYRGYNISVKLEVSAHHAISRGYYKQIVKG